MKTEGVKGGHKDEEDIKKRYNRQSTASDLKRREDRKERYCTTGQGASGPEGGRGGVSEEESPGFTDGPLDSSQPCQKKSVIHLQQRRKLRENDTCFREH